MHMHWPWTEKSYGNNCQGTCPPQWPSRDGTKGLVSECSIVRSTGLMLLSLRAHPTLTENNGVFPLTSMGTGLRPSSVFTPSLASIASLLLYASISERRIRFNVLRYHGDGHSL
ncbi:hypothetical protein KIL84_011510 [Mauremys mutica]|uniref:Uncharacterized protein n=1 Tax=Mauremys mutica TaxID=74926 RepID=A0A9D4B145_9SAUR|nr:hypothetical protein KIL84_011510 [Mauremys mutica]